MNPLSPARVAQIRAGLTIGAQYLARTPRAWERIQTITATGVTVRGAGGIGHTYAWNELRGIA